MFEAYIALGDSMSIDSYAANDARDHGIHCRANIGAAALLYANENSLFPDFEGRDLLTKYRRIKYRNFAVDGATTHDVLANKSLTTSSWIFRGTVLISLTVGGNDLLKAFNLSVVEGPGRIKTGLAELQENYSILLDKICKAFPKATLLLSSVYDPTDGTGNLSSSVAIHPGKLPIEYLVQFNDFVRSTAAARGHIFADVCNHFKGHGATAPDGQAWYVASSPIEPSWIGASEIRRVWIEALSVL